MGPGGGLRHAHDAAGARGEGLEPSITGPEPVVLPITPPPNGWTFRLAERPRRPVRPPDQARGALNLPLPVGRCGARDSPGASRVRRSSACTGGRRPQSSWPVLATGRCRRPGAVRPGPRASDVTIRVTPSRGLVIGQTVTVSGRGLLHSSTGATQTWFVDRVHRRRAGADEPVHRHAPLRRHRTPGHPGRSQRDVHGPLPRRSPGSSATGTAGRRATRPASSVSAPPMAWARSCASPSRPRRRAPAPPT